jgi:hypothetical protein
VGLDKKA